MEPQRAQEITVRKASFGEEDERLDREFWAQMSPDERVEEAWRLSLELREMKGWDTGEPELRRALLRE